MPIRRLLESSTLAADEIDILTRAFDQALRSLNLCDRNAPDPLIETIARQIIEVGASTFRDPMEIAKLALKQLRLP
ncbi:hypothetical protein [Bradyrhizobium sp. AS23.2]|uniref:hypothetical protein n=1 Tax=Bradyrhizobium sp. AS23.2 TaxID=1680155 RepID=UPI00093E0EDC|nr:hypothetical protein [Bradyrhizobium sp. AS23.2]OKO84959.1 hypothetical protein AC630_07295 [Bradyrhizobium sp. AS23.2]